MDSVTGFSILLSQQYTSLEYVASLIYSSCNDFSDSIILILNAFLQQRIQAINNKKLSVYTFINISPLSAVLTEKTKSFDLQGTTNLSQGYHLADKDYVVSPFRTMASLARCTCRYFMICSYTTLMTSITTRANIRFFS
jgi:hypothetical protein